MRWVVRCALVVAAACALSASLSDARAAKEAASGLAAKRALPPASAALFATLHASRAALTGGYNVVSCDVIRDMLTQLKLPSQKKGPRPNENAAFVSLIHVSTSLHRFFTRSHPPPGVPPLGFRSPSYASRRTRSYSSLRCSSPGAQSGSG